MGKTGCAVYQCVPGQDCSRHRFVNPGKNINLFSAWLRATNNELLFDLDPHYIHKHFRICSKHFKEEDFVMCGTRKVLKRDACPTEFLPGNLIEEQETYTFVDHTYAKCLSQEAPQDDTEDHTYAQRLSEESHQDDSVPSTSSCRTPSPLISPSSTGRSEILSSISARTVKELTPRKKFLYNKVTLYRKQKARLFKKRLNFSSRLKEAQRFSKSKDFEKLTCKMNTISRNFFRSQIDCAGKNPKGRRFSLKDKITALALYKQSPSGYNLLSRIFALPSRVTLTKLLKRIPIKTGLCSFLFEGLQKVAEDLSSLERYCILMFDEMSLTPHLQYNQYADVIEGIEDYGNLHTNKIADHVQVFMLRGIARKWKQPVLYHFVKGATHASHIMRTIKEVIVAANNAGFTVLATICDQGSNNVSAIKQLVADTRAKYLRDNQELREFVFEINEQEIIPLFDVPHLLKGVRNNLLKKDIFFEIDGIKKVAKWEDIYNAWLLDNYSGELRVMPKLSEHHVNRDKIKKMKVSTCSQVFSHTVSSAINLMAQTGYHKDDIKLDERAKDTAELLKFMDSLFDSLNGFAPFNKSGKHLKIRVNCEDADEDNIHLNFWKKAKKIISSFYYLDYNKKTLPPTFKNWQVTIDGFILLRKRLKDLKFKNFKPRLFNQDPLENFFGAVRQRGMRNVNPTATTFGSFYKSLLVNNLVGKHSLGSNCEDDKSDILYPLEILITQITKPECLENRINVINIPEDYYILQPLEENAIAYVAGYLTKAKLKIQNCSVCRFNILRRPKEENYNFLDLIKYKEIGGAKTQRLKYVNRQFFECVVKMYNITLYILKQRLPVKSTLAVIKYNILQNVNFNFELCEHSSEMEKQIVDSFCKLLIFNFVNGVNNVMLGKDQRSSKNDCDVFIQAKEIFAKRRANK